jgi:hypothetical protein
LKFEQGFLRRSGKKGSKKGSVFILFHNATFQSAPFRFAGAERERGSVKNCLSPVPLLGVIMI